MHLQNYYDWYHLVKIVLEPAVFSFLHYFFPFFFQQECIILQFNRKHLLTEQIQLMT